MARSGLAVANRRHRKPSSRLDLGGVAGFATNRFRRSVIPFLANRATTGNPISKMDETLVHPVGIITAWSWPRGSIGPPSWRRSLPTVLAPPSPARAAGGGLVGRSFDRRTGPNAARAGAGGPGGGGGCVRDRTGAEVMTASTTFDRPMANHHFTRNAVGPRPPGPPGES